MCELYKVVPVKLCCDRNQINLSTMKLVIFGKVNMKCLQYTYRVNSMLYKIEGSIHGHLDYFASNPTCFNPLLMLKVIAALHSMVSGIVANLPGTITR